MTVTTMISRIIDMMMMMMMMMAMMLIQVLLGEPAGPDRPTSGAAA